MAEVKFEPLADRIIVRPDPEEVEEGGILKPQESIDKPQTGTVVAVGPGTKDYEMKTKPGDKVFFSKYGHVELPTPEEKLIVIEEPNLYCKIST